MSPGRSPGWDTCWTLRRGACCQGTCSGVVASSAVYSWVNPAYSASPSQVGGASRHARGDGFYMYLGENAGLGSGANWTPLGIIWVESASQASGTALGGVQCL
eukprot:366113-Chlamydomonas_euryale.AAC.17